MNSFPISKIACEITLDWLQSFQAFVLHSSDPESFVRGGPNLIAFSFFFFLVDEGFEDLNTTINEWAIIGPPAKPHLNGVSLAGADDCPTLNAGFVASRFSGDPDQY